MNNKFSNTSHLSLTVFPGPKYHSDIGTILVPVGLTNSISAFKATIVEADSALVVPLQIFIPIVPVCLVLGPSTIYLQLRQVKANIF